MTGDLQLHGLKVVAEVMPLNTEASDWMEGDFAALSEALQSKVMEALPPGDVVVSVKVSRSLR